MSSAHVTERTARSRDGARIRFEVSGTGRVALVFVHGWLGRARWWDAAREALAPTHTIVALELAGHGGSSPRGTYAVEDYAADVAAVVRTLDAAEVVLVGHSMSGAHVLVAARELEASVRAIVLVDTLKNLDARQPAELVDRMLASYRSDYAGAVRGVLPAFLYSPATPASVVARLSAEFLEVSGDEAAARLEPYLRFDPREVAQRTVVPVRAIDGDLHPANEAVSRAYFRDFARRELSGCGHYPMIEQPEAFVAALRETLAALGLA